MAEPRPPQPDAPASDPAPVIAVDFAEVRTGEDVRQRGWFWHWNELHTEYGPLLRQAGIGLLTSYIVYTDRREHSPQRGYAFPSLQLQAAFTGADRAELITINQILVALDLLEIRKEMVLRTDEHGHKWRVPHNLYRVKDKSDDRHLTAADVLRVLELAEKRREVYRHIRHIFSADFTPISRGNIWHGLREELRETPIWQRLAARAERDEAKFSERSRAGHAARKANLAGSDAVAAERGPDLEPIPSIAELHGEDGGDRGLKPPSHGRKSVETDWASPRTGYQPGVPGNLSGSESSLGEAFSESPGGRSGRHLSNLDPDVGDSLAGHAETTVADGAIPAGDIPPAPPATSVAPSNQGLATRVASSNAGLDPVRASTDGASNQAPATSVAPSNPMYDQSFQTTSTTTGQGSQEAIDHAGGEPVTEHQKLVTAPVTKAAPSLSQVAAPVHGPDRAAAMRAYTEANGREPSPAEERLLAGIAQEAEQLVGVAEAGELSSGWGVVGAAIYEAVDSGSRYVAPKRVREIVRRWLRDGVPGGEASRRAGEQASSWESAEAGRRDGAENSDQASRDALRGGEARSWGEGEAVRGQGTGDGGQDGASSGQVPGSSSAKIENPEPKTVAVEPKPKSQNPEPENRAPATSNQQPATNERFWVEEGQISSTLLWETIVGELAERGVGRRSDLDMYLRPARFIGRSGERGFELEAPNQHARRRIEVHWLGELERGLARLLGGGGWEIEVSAREEKRRAG